MKCALLLVLESPYFIICFWLEYTELIAQDLETVHNAKLMVEYDKYQELQLKTSEQQSQWEQQMKDMQLAKERTQPELTENFEAKMEEKKAEIDRVQMRIRARLDDCSLF